ncbi:hypothetical protein TNCV_2250841 [Trichonephila clavipes]|nr:hypothetical protein TNCV_2250841 [Trichonephila clavipes]
MNGGHGQWNETTDESRFYLQHHDSWFRMWRHRGEMLLKCCVMYGHTGLAPSIIVWSGYRPYSNRIMHDNTRYAMFKSSPLFIRLNCFL